MAMQAGSMATSKLLLLIGAGLGGSFVLRNGRLSDIIAELQALLKGMDESGEQGQVDSETLAALAAQIRRLAQDVKTVSSRPIILNGSGNSSGNLSSLLLPAAAVGAAGYGYMWWKGWSFSDLMYVTKRNMANAVANVTKQLDQVSAALAATKRHLTQRIEGLDVKLEDQKEMSKLIKNDVNEVREDLQQIGFDIDQIQRMVSGLEGKIGTLEDKQDFANAGVWYLCQFVGEGTKDGRMAKFLQNFQAGKPNTEQPALTSEAKSLKGLQFIADTIQSGTMEKKKADALLQNDIDTPTPKGDSKMGQTRVQRSLTRASLSRTISSDA
eukprot:TRINITY_DN979_c0_g1_i1.p1 TRINITY_DN979_c0_g1~~TRINITY_DN979_c0_g1_i1.p1  ORF type:complete len:326 (-),score=93.00 TRINITY_DN979_c0_g1_i1:358-1335(-)